MFIIRITELNDNMEKVNEANVILQEGEMDNLIKHLSNEPIIKEVVVERPSPFEQYKYDAFNKPFATGNFKSRGG